MTHFFLSVQWAKKLSHLSPKIFEFQKFGSNFSSAIVSNFLGQNDLFFSQCTMRKNWVILTLKFGSNFCSASDWIFLGQNDSFFSLTKRKQKTWVILTKKFGLNFSSASDSIFLGQNDSFFFSLGARSKKIESFWPKKFG